MKIGSNLLAILTLAIPTSISSPAQAHIDIRPCTLLNHQYQCDKPSFEQVLHAGGSISVEAPGLRPSSLHQMEALAQSLGKSVRPGSTLRLVLAPSEADGIYYGPSDRELGTIRAWYGSKLLWVETYNGQPDTPWPIVVNHLTDQFRHNFEK